MTSKVMLTVGLLCLLCSSILVTNKDVEHKKEMIEYHMTIIDEHEVLLTSQRDTLSISFENAYALAGQNDVVFVIQ